MRFTELLHLFDPSLYIDNMLLLVTPEAFSSLKDMPIEGNRIFFYVGNGSMTITLNGADCPVDAASFFDVMENVNIAIKDTSQDIEAWALFVSFEFANMSLKNLRPGPSISFDNSNVPLLPLNQDKSDLIRSQFELIRNCIHNRDAYFSHELTKTYFKSLNLEIGNLRYEQMACPAESASAVFSKKDITVFKFMNLVSKNFITCHNINFYAESLCLSPKHLTRIIKEVTGRTPYSFITYELLRHSLSLLEDSKNSIGQISEQLNFSDQASFCKFFKKHTGMTPLAYQRKKQ